MGELSQHEQDLQKIAGFRLLDDDFMTRVFDGATEEMSYVLTVILGFKVTVIDVRTQYEVKISGEDPQGLISTQRMTKESILT